MPQDLTQYQSEHLFLLIGKNPLPNYVAAKLLGIKNKTRFYLIYSKGTEPYAGYLKTFLEKEFGERCVENLEIDESNPTSITKKIESYFECINSDKVGLSYTGGTKTMAVHSYIAIKNLCHENKLPPPYFSYLNPRELELRFDHLPGRPFKLGDPNHHTDGEYFKKAAIDLSLLLALHGYKLRQADKSKREDEAKFKNPRREPQLLEIARCLFDIYNDDDNREQWKSIVNNLSKTPALLQDCLTSLKETLAQLNSANISNETFSNEEEFITKWLKERWLSYRQSNPVAGSTQATLLNSFSALEQILRAQNLLNDEGNVDVAKYTNVGFPSKAEFIKWLQGKWLEDYLLQMILDLKEKCSLHDCGASLEPAVPGTGNEHKPFFELDVVALRGYQIFVLSCTTAEKNAPCKEKLLEVFVRAKQLGGDEARIALVCGHPNSSELQREIEQSWDVDKKQVKVFGKKEWPRLNEHLEKWFNGKA